MAAMGDSRASSSSTVPSWIYDVFLSFYREDTHEGFVDLLHVALKQKGIITFRDDKKLEREEYISHELLKAIQKSQYAVVVISEKYAFSKWCLIELTEILKCRKETGMIVLHVFCYVDPYDEQKQEERFAKVFAKQSQNTEVDEEQKKIWRTDLKDIGHLSGWHLDDRHKAAIAEDISQKILDGLNHTSLNIFEGLVGIGSRAPELISLLSIGFDDVRFVGIFGMRGIGITTLVKVIYDRVSSQFERSCFVDHVREKTRNHGIVHLQRQLVSKILQESGVKIWNTHIGIDMIKKLVHKKNVLIVLEDVDTEDQLKALVGNDAWFGQGSRIIVTSKNYHLLDRYMDTIYRYVETIYEISELNDAESLKLFSLKAFKKDHPEENYVKLSKDIVRLAEGLPLAIEVFGSYLFGRRMNAWKSFKKQLKKSLKTNILDKLQISFGGLEDSQKKLFLNIACLFNTKSISKNDNKLGCLSDYLVTDIEVLKDKCLIKELYGTYQMDDLLKKMGQQIVYRECPNEPGRRSRLWCYEDIINVFKYNTGTYAIEAIDLDLSQGKQEQLSLEAFSKMKRLKFLVIRNGQFYHGFHTLEWYGDHSNFILSDDLCYLEWVGYPLENLNGWKVFEKLKYINLIKSQNLIETPDFSIVPNLEVLELAHCTSLCMVCPSIGLLKRLKRLNLRGCVSLEQLPSEVSCLSSLEFLDLSGNKFTQILDNVWQLPDLQDLYLEDCSQLKVLSKLPLKLGHLHLKNCPSLYSFCDQIDASTSSNILGTIDLSFWTVYLHHGKPYRILHLHRRSPLWIKLRAQIFDTFVACGLTLGPGIPEWFSQRSTPSFGTIGRRTGLDLDEVSSGWKGCAFFIDFEVYELENSNTRMFGGSNHTSLYFVCRFQTEEVSLREPLVLCVPGLPSSGRHGVWAYIPAEWFGERRNNLDRWSRLEASIATHNPNMRVNHCKLRLVGQHDLSGMHEAVRSISPHVSDLQGWENLFSGLHGDLGSLRVSGPIEGNKMLNTISRPICGPLEKKRVRCVDPLENRAEASEPQEGAERKRSKRVGESRSEMNPG